MVQLAPTPEIEELQSALRSLARNEIAPEAARADRESAMPAPALDRIAQMGFAAPVDERFGGQGIPSALTMALVAEELALGDPGIAYEVVLGAHAALAVARLGTDEQQARVAEQALGHPAGLGSLLLYEGFGRGPDELRTRATRAGEAWRLSGRKIAVVRPTSSAFAVIFASSDDSETLAFIVDGDRIAQSIVRDDNVVGKLGLRAAHTGIVELRDLTVDDSNLLSTDATSVARAAASARLSAASVTIAAGTLSLRYAAHYATERETFGKAIAAYQGVAFPLAEVEMGLDAARLGIWDLAGRLEEIESVSELTTATTSAVAAANSAAYAASVVGINTLGGHGYLEDHPVERWYRAIGTLLAIDNDCLVGQA